MSARNDMLSFQSCILPRVADYRHVMPSKGKISVVIVDDHPLFRQGLRLAIEMDARFELVGEADNGPDALEIIGRLQPAVAVLDVNLPGMNGLGIAGTLAKEKTKTHLV